MRWAGSWAAVHAVPQNPALVLKYSGGATRRRMARGEKDKKFAAVAPELRSFLDRHLQRRLPGLKSESEDLANAAMADLLQWYRRQARGDHSLAELRRVGSRILHRRVADRFRKHIPAYGARPLPTLRSPDAAADERLLQRQAIRLCIQFLSELGYEDRQLLIGDFIPAPSRFRVNEDAAEAHLAAGGSEHVRDSQLTPRERKRRQRLRERLRKRLRKQLGIEVEQLLRG